MLFECIILNVYNCVFKVFIVRRFLYIGLLCSFNTFFEFLIFVVIIVDRFLFLSKGF